MATALKITLKPTTKAPMPNGTHGKQPANPVTNFWQPSNPQLQTTVSHYTSQAKTKTTDGATTATIIIGTVTTTTARPE